MKNTKYEYDIIDADYGYVIGNRDTREAARQTKRDYQSECPKQKFAIIQRKYVLQEQREVR